MEKNFYLTKSNCKYITIGIKPATKFINQNNIGFYVEVALCGGKMKPMSLGGLDGFLNLCKSLRSFEELQYTYPMSAGDYSEIETPFPLNILKRPWGGAICFNIETINGEMGSMAQNSASDLLKFENLIISSIKKLQAIVENIEDKFNELVYKCVADFTSTMNEVRDSMDTFGGELFTNFNELLKICIDKVSLLNAHSAAAANTITGKANGSTGKNTVAPKRKKASVTKRSKKSKAEADHSYFEHDENDEIEIIEGDAEIPSDAADEIINASTSAPSDVATTINQTIVE